jgi:hypothetical protein
MMLCVDLYIDKLRTKHCTKSKLSHNNAMGLSSFEDRGRADFRNAERVKLWKKGIRWPSNIIDLILGVGILSFAFDMVHTNRFVVAPNRNSQTIVFNNNIVIDDNNHPKTHKNRMEEVSPTPEIIELSSKTNTKIKATNNNHPKTHQNRTEQGVLPTPETIELSSETNAKIKATNNSNGTLNIFIHIGPHKTGSTFLQNLMAEQHAKLKEDKYFYIGKLNPPRHLRKTKGLPPMKDLVRPFRERQNPEGDWKYSLKGNKAKHELLKQIQTKHTSPTRTSFDTTEQEMDYLENRTRELDNLFFSVTHSVVGLDGGDAPSYLRKFQEAQSQYKFCNVDLDLMFQDSLWKNYVLAMPCRDEKFKGVFGTVGVQKRRFECRFRVMIRTDS